MPHRVITGFPAVELYGDSWVFVVGEDYPEVGDALTLDDLGRLPWAVYQRTHDAGHLWLRETAASVGAEISQQRSTNREDGSQLTEGVVQHRP